MHYADGTPAKAGDLVINTQKYGDKSGSQTVGILTGAHEVDSKKCNGNLCPVARRSLTALGWGPWLPVQAGFNDWTVTVGECLQVDWNDLAIGTAVQQGAPAVEVPAR